MSVVAALELFYWAVGHDGISPGAVKTQFQRFNARLLFDSGQENLLQKGLRTTKLVNFPPREARFLNDLAGRGLRPRTAVVP